MPLCNKRPQWHVPDNTIGLTLAYKPSVSETHYVAYFSVRNKEGQEGSDPQKYEGPMQSCNM